MTENEVGNFVVLLLVAGIETTTSLIGNAILALLARLETRVALDAVLSRFPRLALAGDVTRAASFLGRGALSIPLRVD